MWVPFAVLLGLFSLLVGGLTGAKIAANQCQAESSITSLRNIPAVTPSTDIESQK